VLEEKEALPFFEKAFAAGINFLDTADSYSLGLSEEIVGRAIKTLRVDREDVVITTKVWRGTHRGKVNRHGLSRKHIIAECDASLRRLGTDYIDLYQIHRYDETAPMEETLEALTDLVRVGKVRYIGASSMHAWQFAKFLRLADRHGFARFMVMQNYYNLIYREEEREMIPLCADEGIGLLPWSPLARGFLTGNRSRDKGPLTERAGTDKMGGYVENDFDVLERNQAIAQKLGASPATTAIAWILANPAVSSVVIGASKLAHLDGALAALTLDLAPADKAALEEPYKPHSVFGIDV
jgi:aryl-alcohol dehydrogenase (NADP+)